jgi:hypothetical protein
MLRSAQLLGGPAMKAMIFGGILATALVAAPTQIQAQAAGQAAVKGTPATELGRRQEFSRNLSSEAIFSEPEQASATYSIGTGIARCMVGVSGAKAGELIGGPNTSDANYRTLSRAIQRRYTACVRDGSVPPMVVNYGLAEALVLRNESLSFEDRAMNVNVDEAEAFMGTVSGQATMDSIARCLAVYSPGLAHKVVLSGAGSPDEMAALHSLYAQTPECGLSAPPDAIPSVYQRGALAVALYQWANKNG